MRKLRALIYKWISQRFMNGCSNYNSLPVRKGCRSKQQARTVFAHNQVPHANGMIFFWPWAAFRFAKKHGFPLVIKPNVSGFSRGSYFPITDSVSLLKAIFKAKLWWPTTVVEQYLLGSNYRVLSTQNQIISVIRRYPPFVIGDGTKSIRQLMHDENQIRQQMQLFPVMHRLMENKQTRQHLKKQGLDFDSVPEAGQQITLFHRIALAPGGVIETIDINQLPEKNIALFKQIVANFNANVLGIDVIFAQGIETPYDQQRCIFIEVNSRPYIKMHDYPRYGEKQDISTKLTQLESLQIQDKDIF